MLNSRLAPTVGCFATGISAPQAFAAAGRAATAGRQPRRADRAVTCRIQKPSTIISSVGTYTSFKWNLWDVLRTVLVLVKMFRTVSRASVFLVLISLAQCLVASNSQGDTSSSYSSSESPRARQPHIIFILADDMASNLLLTVGLRPHQNNVGVMIGLSKI